MAYIDCDEFTKTVDVIKAVNPKCHHTGNSSTPALPFLTHIKVKNS